MGERLSRKIGLLKPGGRGSKGFPGFGLGLEINFQNILNEISYEIIQMYNIKFSGFFRDIELGFGIDF